MKWEYNPWSGFAMIPWGVIITAPDPAMVEAEFGNEFS